MGKTVNIKDAIRSTFAAYGATGGRSRSPAKVAAARKNAAKAAEARRANGKGKR